MMDYKIEYFEKYNDKRGQLVVFLRNQDLKKKQKAFGQIYFVTFDKKNSIRGNHYHKKWREWFGVVSGRLKVVFMDMKTKEKKEFILDGSDTDKYIRLEIGPNVAHAFKNISDRASLLNYSDKEWSASDTFQVEVMK